MNESDVKGKGVFIYMTVLSILTLLAFLIIYFFDIDIDPIYKNPKAGLLEVAAWCILGTNFIFVLWHSSIMKGWKRAFFACFATVFIAWLAEGLGVHYGMVFGHYHYTNVFQPQIWGVPLQICLAWEPILYSSYLITDFLVPSQVDKSLSFKRRVLPYLMLAGVGALVTTVWDLMADPFAVTRPWWVWENGGPYMHDILGGVPLKNYLGWFEVAFVCHLVYRVVMESAPKVTQSVYLNIYGPMMLYCNLFVFGIGMSALFLKRMDVVLIGLLSMGGIALFALARMYLIKSGKVKDSWGNLRVPIIDDIIKHT